MSRYSVPRQILSWHSSDELMCLKMLVYVLHKHEADCRNRYRLWDRVIELCPSVMRSVLSKDLTFKDIRESTLARTGIPITTNRLYNRADKAKRYKEFNVYLDCVESAYRLIVSGRGATTAPSFRDQKRTFTDAQVSAALEAQGGRCYYRGCDCSEGVVGDHKIPHSEGGPTEVFNCAAACYRCNSEKSSMSVFEYGKLIGRQNARGRQL